MYHHVDPSVLPELRVLITNIYVAHSLSISWNFQQTSELPTILRHGTKVPPWRLSAPHVCLKPAAIHTPGNFTNWVEVSDSEHFDGDPSITFEV